ncbi:MAG: hypothetical protein KDE51_26945, partial [Anaerolineales bacterium]|nr:hypothetical protein [Anaerolineales bacterium]
MKQSPKFFLLASLLAALVILVACQPQVVTETVEVTRVVTETIVEEGETVEVTRVVTEVETVTETVVEERVEVVSPVVF